MKNLLNWNNFIAVTEGKNGSYDLEFQGDGIRMLIRGAEITESVTIDGEPQHPLLYWQDKHNIERAIEQADGFDIVRELSELDEVVEINRFDELIEELVDIATDVNRIGANFEKRLDKVGLALQNHEENVTLSKVMLDNKETKNEVALTAKQLADLGEMLLTNKETLEFQIHALGLVKTPKEVNNEELIVHYNEVYRLTDDMFRVNQAIVKRIDEVAFLLLESTNKDEIEAHYNK